MDATIRAASVALFLLESRRNSYMQPTFIGFQAARTAPERLK
ncbi:hypothetical protein FIU97_00860 [Roseivivax sp. THAF40]|nr:hypothetical protein FIV09_00945 [Roseivivax sp. THAF197b]QFT45110.1 hypothetical protein FIU97_00860 [Roseivivax sp. THAF40]